MKAIYQTINNTYIISEFCSQGNIGQLIEKNKRIPESKAKVYLY